MAHWHGYILSGTVMKAKRQHAFEPDYVVSPGATLTEVMESLRISQHELVQKTGLHEKTLTRILDGVHQIFNKNAKRLELGTGVPARMWSNLEVQYREQLAKQERH